ncbi:MAG: adenine deaminase [Nitrososphaerales archaeon]|nr:adenine deaminase [Nitrososphaerales archaeon]
MSVPSSEYVSAALGTRGLTLLIRNATLLNVFTGETYETSIGVYQDRIVYVGTASEGLTATETIDAKGMIAIPGLIDSHLHVESSMVTPSKFAEATLPHGLTTAFADPHEIANVMGKQGVRAMIEDSRGLPLKLYFYVPTCVPESKAVTAGAELTSSDIEEMLGWPGIWGLGEVMDYPAVLRGEQKMVNILKSGIEHDAVVDGHAPLLSGRELNAYIASGVEADHEIFTVQTMLEKFRLGMYVKLRGPYVLDTKKFVKGLKRILHPYNLILCTDDVMPDNLANLGHLDYVCRTFIEEGMDPVEVVRSATLRPALHMRMHRLGAISPGRVADIVLLKSLKKFAVELVVANGVPVAKQGKMLVDLEKRTFDSSARNTMKLKPLKLEDFDVHPPLVNGSVYVNAIDFRNSKKHKDEGERFFEMVLTKLNKVRVDIKNGQLSLGNVALVFVFERHGKNGGKAFGFVRNLIGSGAVATTVAHDAHNLLVVGTDARDMQAAANLVIESKGGIAAVKGLKTLARIKLPIAGLMSDQPLEQVSKEMQALRNAFKKIGVLDHPYMPLPCLLALSVIPHARITDKGIFDVDKQRFVVPFVA